MRQCQRRNSTCSDKPVREVGSRDCLHSVRSRLTYKFHAPLAGIAGPQCGKASSIKLEISRLHDNATATIHNATAPTLRQSRCLEDFGEISWIKHNGEDAASILILRDRDRNGEQVLSRQQIGHIRPLCADHLLDSPSVVWCGRQCFAPLNARVDQGLARCVGEHDELTGVRADKSCCVIVKSLVITRCEARRGRQCFQRENYAAELAIDIQCEQTGGLKNLPLQLPIFDRDVSVEKGT